MSDGASLSACPACAALRAENEILKSDQRVTVPMFQIEYLNQRVKALTARAEAAEGRNAQLQQQLKDAVQTARNYYMLFHDETWLARLTKWEAALLPRSPEGEP